MVETKKKVVKKAPTKKVEVKSKSSVTKKKVIVKENPIKKSNQNLIFSIILGLFIIISAFQSFQINNLQNQIENGGVKISTSSNSYSSSNSGGGKSQVPSSIKDLPQMVGGC